MAFPRQRDDWYYLLEKHEAELRACGLPDHLVANKLRFSVFLEHGFHQWEWAKTPHACFDARVLTDEQTARSRCPAPLRGFASGWPAARMNSADRSARPA